MDLLDRLQLALADRYRIERELGRGGMATVYLAEDLKHARPVALKVLRPEISPALGADRFHREIAIASRLQHPNILTLHDSGEAAGLLYYSMPYVEGESLRARLRREVQLKVEDAVRIGSEVAEALACAHAAGVLHRDIKPENILLTSGHAVVADFGIARAIDVAGGEHLTETGLALGTPHYMSPEQASGARALDARSDLYALGCVVYEMLAGEPPFNGPTSQVILTRHSVDPVPSLRTIRSTISPALEAAVAKALAKVPADRFGTALEFDQALTRALSEPGHNARPLGLRRSIATALLVVGAGLGAVIVGGIHGDRSVVTDNARTVRSLAVRPFANLTGDSAQLYLAEGITDQLVATLAQIGPLRVIRLEGDRAGIAGPELARGQGIDAVVGGSLQRSGDAVRITAQLNAAATGQALWARSYDGEMHGILVLQDRVAQSIAERLQVGAPARPEAAGSTRRKISPAAYEAFVRGSHFWRKGTEADFRKSIGYFQRAIDIEPTYAAAYAGLARTFIEVGYFAVGSPQETFPKARAAARRALELDSGLADAHAAIARFEYLYAWDFAAADRAFRRALELSPNSLTVPHSYATYLAAMGRRAESIAEAKRVQELDPLSLIAQAVGARAFYNARLYREAIDQSLSTLELDSTYHRSRFWLGLAYEQAGRRGDAVRELEKTVARAGRIPVYLAALGHAYVAAGDRDRALRVLGELRGRTGPSYTSPVDIATVYVGLGDKDSAFTWLERAYEGRAYGLVFMNVDPRFDALRSDPRFADLLRRIGQQPAAAA